MPKGEPWPPPATDERGKGVKKKRPASLAGGLPETEGRKKRDCLGFQKERRWGTSIEPAHKPPVGYSAKTGTVRVNWTLSATGAHKKPIDKKRPPIKRNRLPTYKGKNFFGVKKRPPGRPPLTVRIGEKGKGSG